MKYEYEYPSPIGRIVLEEEDGAITGLHLTAGTEENQEAAVCRQETSLLREAHRQLEEYFAGTRREFSLPLKLEGTEFQQKVWAALREIPYGETRSYGELASRIGNPKASRAVGGANHNNPVMIFVPCHRVIGKDGSLVGFGGGLDAKRYLLELEQKTEE